MNRNFAAAIAALVAISATAPAFAGPQTTEGLTLEQVAAVSYNNGKSLHDQQAVVKPNSGTSEGLALAIENYNRGKSQTDIQAQAPDTAAVAASRAANFDASAHAQLIASAGLTQEEAEGLTLNEIVAAKYNRGRSVHDQQRVGDAY